jgi:RNA polymerase sigma factor
VAGLTFRRKKSEDTDQLYSLLQLAKAGNEEARNDLIRTYIPFILRAASQVTGRYIDRERDDEYSIALLAMNEAIDSFDGARKTAFLSFAETIIKRRLIDYFRAQKSGQRSVPWTDFDYVDEEDNVINYVEVQTSVEAHAKIEEQAVRSQEIAEYAMELAKYGLSFKDLVESSPKHADARRNAFQVARLILSDEEMKQYVLQKNALPLKWLESRAGVSRKTMERQRKYIMAIVILLCGEYPHLRDYITEC